MACSGKTKTTGISALLPTQPADKMRAGKHFGAKRGAFLSERSLGFSGLLANWEKLVQIAVTD
jgi:hypothetical protein